MQSCLLALFGIAALIGADQPASSGLGGTVVAPPRETQGGSAPVASPKQEGMVLRARVAQLMLVTLQGMFAPNEEDLAFLKQFTPGGVVIPVVVKPQDAADYVTELRKMPLESVSGVPLLIGANVYDLPRHDRGAPTTFAQLPSLLSIAASADLDATKRLAGLTADHLKTMGFNLNLGPALDLAPALSGVVGTVQNLGSNPKFTAQAGGCILETLDANGILSMPMGFPGGSANHTPKSPATLLTPSARLAETDLFPYAQAVEHGAKLIHVANTLVPTVDTESRPASVSPVVMQTVLRGGLKFDGVIVAGPMDAADIKRLFEPNEAAVQALRAGADMLYWSSAGPHVLKAIEGVARAVESGTLDDARIRDALERVMKLKKEAGLRERPLPSKSRAASLATKGRIPKETYEVERRSITLLQNRGGVLPLKKDESTPIGVTGVVGVDAMQKLLSKFMKPVVMQSISTAQHVGDIEDFEIRRLTENSRGLNVVICIFPNTAKTQGQVRLVRALKENGSKVVVVSLGYPGNLPKFVEADAIVAAYCDEAMCLESVHAVADILVGEGPVAILPPVRPLNTQVGKEESFNAADVTRSPSGRLPVSVGEPFNAGFTLSYDTADAIKKAAWDFGDGSHASAVAAHHAYKAPGDYTVKLSITDKHGDDAEGAFQVHVE